MEQQQQRSSVPSFVEQNEVNPKSSNTSRFSSGTTSSSSTSVQVPALDGLVNVNSLFSIAVFVGLSFVSPDQHSLGGSACDASIHVAKKLLVYEVISFSFFLFSSLVAQGLKLAINLLNGKDVDEAFRVYMNRHVLRYGMLALAIRSVIGCVFLMLSMEDLIQIRLGILSCGSQLTNQAVYTLIITVAYGLVVYISTVIYAFIK